nr:uncharacterized protein LOC109183393 [Ipomoea batatas]
MKLSSDADILGLITDIAENKELDINVEHLYDDQWDYEVEIDREQGDDTLMHDAVESEDDISGSVGEEFVEVEGVDVRDTATSSHGQGLDGLGKQKEEFAEVECNLSEQVLRSLKKGDLPELYVHHCYFVEQYLRAYGPAILPIRAEELWHKTYLPPPLPPKYKAQPVQQPHSHVPQQPVSHQVEETHEVQGQFEDVVVETQVPDFVLNEMPGGDNAIPTISNFISTATTAAAANEPTSTRKKYLTIGGIKYTYYEAYLIRK